MKERTTECWVLRWLAWFTKGGAGTWTAESINNLMKDISNSLCIKIRKENILIEDLLFRCFLDHISWQSCQSGNFGGSITEGSISFSHEWIRAFFEDIRFRGSSSSILSNKSNGLALMLQKHLLSCYISSCYDAHGRKFKNIKTAKFKKRLTMRKYPLLSLDKFSLADKYDTKEAESLLANFQAKVYHII